MKLIQVFALLSLIGLASCHYKINKELTAGGQTEQTVAVVDFAVVMKEVIGPKCLECHSSARGDMGGLNLETFQNVKAAINGIVQTTANDFMPLNRPPLTSAQKSLLARWVQAGAPENAGGVTNPPTPPIRPPPPSEEEPLKPALDWVTVRTLVIEPKCLGCHSAPSPRAGVNLETYAEALRNIVDVDRTIREGSMPRRSTLTPEQKNLILEWIQNGAPEFITTNGNKELL